VPEVERWRGLDSSPGTSRSLLLICRGELEDAGFGLDFGDVSSANCWNLERRLFTGGGNPVSSLPNSSMALQAPRSTLRYNK
jgi:hypothetical protein